MPKVAAHRQPRFQVPDPRPRAMVVPQPNYARAVYAPEGYGHAPGRKPLDDFKSFQREDWDQEMEQILEKLPSQPRDLASLKKKRRCFVVRDAKTGHLTLGHPVREKCMAQRRAQLADRFGTTIAFPDSDAGRAQRQLHELLVMVSKPVEGRGQKASRRLKSGGWSVERENWLGTCRQLCLARGAYAVEVDRWRFPDGSVLRVAEDGAWVE